MADYLEDLRTRLLADATLASLIGPRLSYVMAEPAETRPYVVGHVIRNEPMVQSSNGPGALHQAALQWDCVADTLADARAVETALRGALASVAGWASSDWRFGRLWIDDFGRTDYDEPQDGGERGLFRVIVECQIQATNITAYDLLTDPALRAAWLPSGMRDSGGGSLAHGESVAQWLDAVGDYNATQVVGTAPLGATSGAQVTLQGATGAVWDTITNPGDSAGTVALIVRLPDSVITNDDNDCAFHFGSTVSNLTAIRFTVDAVDTNSDLTVDAYEFRLFAMHGGVQTTWDGDDTFAAGSWHRVIWTADGSGYACWVDGVAQTLTKSGSTITDGSWLDDIPADLVSFLARRTVAAAADLPFLGRLAAVVWFNGAKNAGEVAELDAALEALAAGLA